MAFFETAADLRHYMINQNIFDYHELLKVFDIDLVYTDEMPAHCLGLAIPNMKTVFINNELSGIGQQFIEAHEVTHALLGNESAAFYNSSYVSNRKTELSANHGAFFILLRSYVSYWNISKDGFNMLNFLTYFKIPNMYYFQIESFIENNLDEIFA